MSRILCKEITITRPGSRGDEMKDSGRIMCNAAALAFPLIVGDVATEMRSGIRRVTRVRNMVLV